MSASPSADLKTVLSATFTTALNDQIAAVHPCRGVKTPTVARKPRTIVTPEQFDLIHQALPDGGWRVLVELDVETGLRWGELTELRVRDVNATTRMLTVARAVVRSTPASATPTRHDSSGGCHRTGIGGRESLSHKSMPSRRMVYDCEEPFWEGGGHGRGGQEREDYDQPRLG